MSLPRIRRRKRPQRTIRLIAIAPKDCLGTIDRKIQGHPFTFSFLEDTKKMVRGSSYPVLLCSDENYLDVTNRFPLTRFFIAGKGGDREYGKNVVLFPNLEEALSLICQLLPIVKRVERKRVKEVSVMVRRMSRTVTRCDYCGKSYADIYYHKILCKRKFAKPEVFVRISKSGMMEFRLPPGITLASRSYLYLSGYHVVVNKKRAKRILLLLRRKSRRYIRLRIEEDE